MTDLANIASPLLAYLFLYLVISLLVWDKNRRKTKGNRAVLLGFTCERCGCERWYGKATTAQKVVATVFFPLGLLAFIAPTKFCDECEGRIKGAPRSTRLAAETTESSASTSKGDSHEPTDDSNHVPVR